MPKLEIRPFSLGELATNCYLVWDEHSRAAIIIDPADDGSFITEQILELQLTPTAIVLTHGHFDHVLGMLEVKLNFDVPILMHEADVFLLRQAQSSALHWLKRQVDPVPLPDNYLSAGQKIKVGTQTLEVLETPGHTPGSISLFNDEVVFTGDTLFKGTVGRTDFRYSSHEQLVESVHHLLELPSNLLVLSGHGELTTVGEALEPSSEWSPEFLGGWQRNFIFGVFRMVWV